MCSISWAWPTDEADVFSVIFNRDEQKKRPIAIPPKAQYINGVKSLMPIDPVGNGSWFAVNEYGIVIALLNLYEVEILSKQHTSRGILVKQLSGCKTLDEAVKLLEEKTNSNSTTSYAPFSLLIFDKKKKCVHFTQWDQKTLVEKELQKGIEHQFFCSSSWNTKEVRIYRDEAYKKHQATLNSLISLENIKSRREFHRGASQDQERSSVYMTREETQTVSVLELIADNKTISLDYYDRSTDTSSDSSIALL